MEPVQKHTTKSPVRELLVGTNECRLAHHGERLVAKRVSTDIVVTVQVPNKGFAALLRFGVSEEPTLSRAREEALWNFADEALTLLIDSIKTMDVSTASIVVSAIGGAETHGITAGRVKKLILAIRKSLWKHRLCVAANDLGGKATRSVWLESATGRLIVRSDVGSGNTPALAISKPIAQARAC